MRTPLIALLGLGISCTGTGFDYAGHNIYEYFPLDGNRTWEYVSETDGVDWQLGVEKMPQTSSVDGSEVITLEYSVLETELLYSVDWSSDSQRGIRIYGYTVEGGDSVDFDEPVNVADRQMAKGESVETSTNGTTYTSTFEAVEDCPNLWTADVWECLYFIIEDGDGDDSVGAPFAGHWWIANDWGTSRFIPTGYSEPWVLSDGNWTDSSD